MHKYVWYAGIRHNILQLFYTLTSIYIYIGYTDAWIYL